MGGSGCIQRFMEWFISSGDLLSWGSLHQVWCILQVNGGGLSRPRVMEPWYLDMSEAVLSGSHPGHWTSMQFDSLSGHLVGDAVLVLGGGQRLWGVAVGGGRPGFLAG